MARSHTALRALRRARGLTQDALAAAATISQSRLSLAERKKVTLRVHELDRLARVFGVRPT